MIICAAILIEHTDKMLKPLNPWTVCGHRHGDCFKIAHHLDLNIVCCIEGFIDHKGRFLDRKEALKHAIECGQLSETHRYYREDHNIDELYSEDLY